MFVIIVGHDDVPAVHAEFATVGDGVSGLEFTVWMAEQVTCAPAVDANDVGWRSHVSDRSGPAAPPTTESAPY